MTSEEKLKIALDALRRIANIKTASCERYVQIADEIAIEALVTLES